MTVNLSKEHDEYHGNYQINYHGDYKPVHKSEKDCNNSQSNRFVKERATISLAKPTETTASFTTTFETNVKSVESEEDKKCRLEEVEEWYKQHMQLPYKLCDIELYEREQSKKKYHRMVAVKVGLSFLLLVIMIVALIYFSKDVFSFLSHNIENVIQELEEILFANTTSSETESFETEIDLLALLISAIIGGGFGLGVLGWITDKMNRYLR